MRLTLPISSIAISAILVAAACSSAPEPVPGPDPDSLAREQARRDSIAREQARQDSIRRAQDAERRAREQARRDSIAAVQQETAAVRQMLARRVHFDFDRSDIRPGEDTEVLEEKLAIMRANPSLRLEVEGHCDERGTDAYNVALGNRRALAVKQFLVDRGIDEARISTVSRGEEQPLVRASNEDAWAQNRRDEFRIIAGGNALTRPSGM